MKIAIPVDEKDMGTKVCVSFGRAPNFLIYDTETQEGVFWITVQQPAQAELIKAAQTVVDNKVDALLTPRCGENAADVLKAADIIIYKTNGVDLKKNIDTFVDGKLPLLEEIHAGFHGHGGN